MVVVVVCALDLGDRSMAMNDDEEVLVLLLGVVGALHLMAVVVVLVVVVVVVVGCGEATRGESICMRCRAKGADATAACWPAVAVVGDGAPKGLGTTVLVLLLLMVVRG